MTKSQKIGITILRLSLAFVFLWFGFAQLSDAASWVSVVPQWATSILPAGTLVLLNATFEIICGIFLAFGILTRVVGIVLGIHLLVIALAFGMTAIGVRDLGLALATLALGLIGGGEYVFVPGREARNQIVNENN